MNMLIILCLVLHFVADFLLQSREMGKKKSTEVRWLFKHLAIQWIIFAFGLEPFLGPEKALLFSAINTAVHGVIDWNIWRGYKLLAYRNITHTMKSLGVYGSKPEESPAYQIALQENIKNFKYWEDHYFYATIGLDQLLHTATIVVLLGVLV
jgi:hypothetical protein